jgi:hypothetical protein
MHRDAGWSLLEMHLSDRCSLIECGSNGRRHRVGEDAKSPLDLRPHLLRFVLLLRHPCLQLMRKQPAVLPPTSSILAAWGPNHETLLARSLATSRSASSTPPTRDNTSGVVVAGVGTRCTKQCFHQAILTLATVAALWLPCAIEMAVNKVESLDRRPSVGLAIEPGSAR